MIFSIVRTSLIGLRRDRGALALSFVLPIAFFSIFAVIFGGRHNTTPKVSVIVVDEDHSAASQKLLQGLENEGSLVAITRPEDKNKTQQPDYTAATGEQAVKEGVAPVALIISKGFGEHPIALDGGGSSAKIQLLKDSSDMIAPQVVSGLLQKVAITAMPEFMAKLGLDESAKFAGGFTPEQRQRIDEGLARLRKSQEAGGKASSRLGADGLIAVTSRDVVGQNRDMVSFYAAAIGVMFLLFTASGAGGALLEEVESGTLDRVLSTRINMTTLLAGKLTYSATLAFAQLVLMFLWARVVFKLDFIPHLAGFVIMGVCTAFAVAAFGMLLASLCETRAQLGPLSTLVILLMSSIGGSMFPRFLMPPAMQKAGLLTINGWAIDGFIKIFWRDEPISHLWPQVAVLLSAGVALFLIARRLAKRWEYA